jgi:hypothetical protein
MRKKIITQLLSYLITLFLVRNVSASLKINEIYPAPEAGEFEWVEIYNDEDKTIDITGYYLTDATQKASHRLLFDTGSIAAFGFVIATASSGVLNNSDGDTVILKNAAGETVESVAYTGTYTFEKSYFRCLNGGTNWFTSTNITKNASNETACGALTPTPTATPTPTSTPTPTLTPTPRPTSTSTPTPTASPTPKPSPTPTNKPTPTSKIANVSSLTNHSIKPSASSEVLGTKTENKKKASLMKLLFLTPFIFSLLTIIVIFLKIKKAL